jgi:hypothetical protein
VRYDNPRLANVILGDRTSLIMQICGEDPSCYVGYFCDIRGLRVCTDELRLRKAARLGKPGPKDVALVIGIGDEVSPVHPSQLTFDHTTKDYVGV